MRTFTKLIAIAFVGTIAMASSCKKPVDEPIVPTCVGGKGGNLTVVAFLEHHGKPIVSTANHLDTVYVKYNTKDFPGSITNFDTLIVGAAGEDHIHVSGLKCGDYYIYAGGFDTTINLRVFGGKPFSTTQTTGEVNFVIPVTE